MKRAPLLFLWQSAWSFARRLRRGRLLLMAAALSYYLFLSAIPGLLLFLSVGSFILGGGRQAEQALAYALQHAFPEAATLGSTALEGAARAILAHRGVVSGVSLLALLWIGASFFDALEMSLNMVWHVADDRPFHWRKLHSFALVVVGGVLAWVSFAVSTGMEIAAGAVYRAAPGRGEIWLAYQALAGLVAMLLAAFTFALFYVVLPNRRVRLGPAAIGAVTAAVLWELAKTAFNHLMTQVQGYQPVYGSVAKLVVVLMWLFFTSVVILLGGHVSASLQLRAERAEARGSAREVRSHLAPRRRRAQLRSWREARQRTAEAPGPPSRHATARSLCGRRKRRADSQASPR